ncbi:ESX-1 secretion-associated protein [Micromonospora peucetia]|uniref:ESX-1 secretion-associated protein n=1 Tax=Micromonospora peucetia TaxID=47871 RepID=A0ABZ1EEE9_9ACTN|nr:type VII secretion target [Micromonospora peucetia]MCX4391249.1 ESX-1 secretion-associated protein [Micromonospora peucetia]WSA32158.1 ESX-1 secretion-associated protein [Micromonospora peucetia]
MPPGDGIHVRPENLTAHAGRLDQAADRLDTAKAAGQHVRLGAHAYGQLCALMPMLLDDLQRTLVDGIGTAAGSVRDTAQRLRVGAERYRAADTRAEQLLDQVRRQQ